MIYGQPVEPTCTERFSDRVESALWHQWADANWRETLAGMTRAAEIALVISEGTEDKQ